MLRKSLVLLSGVLVAPMVLAAGSHPDETPSAVAAPAYAEVFQQAVPMPLTAFTGNIDIDYVKALLQQSQATLQMAETVLENSQLPGIRSVAENMINSKNAEIRMLQNWLDHLNPELDHSDLDHGGHGEQESTESHHNHH